MSKNSFKAGNDNRKGLFQKVEEINLFSRLFAEGLPVGIMPKVMFITFLAVIYIGNNHMAEKNIRRINRLEQKVEDLRADYTTLKADYMFASKQSEVAKRIRPQGLKESTEPPKKIVIDPDEY